jgi:uncharacterized protein
MANGTILITGGTGMIGQALTSALLNKGYEVIIVTRKKSERSTQSVPGISYAEWNIEKQIIDQDAIKKADHIVHLAGAGVTDKRWTKKRKLKIASSRIDSGKLIVDSLKIIPNKVKTVISASAIGWYGPDPQIPNPRPFIEQDPAADNFLGQTSKAWEGTLEPLTAMHKRLVIFRMGIVLSKSGAALKEFLKPLRFRVGTVLGNGRQMISWIHAEDLVRLYIQALENNSMNGVYNAVSPFPVSNAEFVKTLAQVKFKNGFILVKIPAAILRLVLGEMSMEALKSATVSASRILASGFKFNYPAIKQALHEIINSNKSMP